MNFLLDVPVLYGSLVRLEPLSVSHGEDLAVAAEEDRGAYGFTRVPHAWEIEEYLIAHFEQTKSGKLVPFAQLRQGDGRAVGCTAYWDPRFWPGRSQLYAIEIGWTWLAASAQRTGINVEASFYSWNMRSRPWAWSGSTSRPTPATGNPGARSSAWARTSRACFETGRSRTRPGSRVSSAIPRCSR
jgi:hypothetical protein